MHPVPPLTASCKTWYTVPTVANGPISVALYFLWRHRSLFPVGTWCAEKYRRLTGPSKAGKARETQNAPKETNVSTFFVFHLPPTPRTINIYLDPPHWPKWTQFWGQEILWGTKCQNTLRLTMVHIQIHNWGVISICWTTKVNWNGRVLHAFLVSLVWTAGVM